MRDRQIELHPSLLRKLRTSGRENRPASTTQRVPRRDNSPFPRMRSDIRSTPSRQLDLQVLPRNLNSPHADSDGELAGGQGENVGQENITGQEQNTFAIMCEDGSLLNIPVNFVDGPVPVTEDVESNNTSSYIVAPPPASSVVPIKPIYGFDLETVLQSKADRQAIANVLVEALVENLGTSPSKHAMEQLAKNLVQSYPTFGDPLKKGKGWGMWFNHSIHASAASGFLEERLKNQRKRLAKRKQGNNIEDDDLAPYLLKWESEDEDEDPEPNEKFLEFLRHNTGEQVKPLLKETVFQRRTIIRRLLCVEDQIQRREAYSTKIPAIMPRLFDIEGIIVQDFNIRHPNLALVVYDRWPKASQLLFQYAEESDVNYSKLLHVSKSRYDLTDGDILIIAYCLLPYIMPSCARKLRADSDDSNTDDQENPTKSRKRKKGVKKVSSAIEAVKPKRRNASTVKASDMDCLESMILFKPKNTSVASILAENKQPAPFILGLGTTYDMNIEEFFVVLHKVAVPCGSSFMVALDTCLKSTTVLYVPPPIESCNHWMFLQHGIAGKPVQQPLPPVVQALIGQIMPRI